MKFLIAGIVIFLAVGIIPTVLITVYYEKKPINPYLPALVVWLLGFSNYAVYKIRSLIQNIGVDPIGQVFTLSVMAIAVISSSISWVLVEVWARQKGMTRMKLRRLVMVLNILTIVLPVIYMFILLASFNPC